MFHRTHRNAVGPRTGCQLSRTGPLAGARLRKIACFLDKFTHNKTVRHGVDDCNVIVMIFALQTLHQIAADGDGVAFRRPRGAGKFQPTKIASRRIHYRKCVWRANLHPGFKTFLLRGRCPVALVDSYRPA